MDLQDMPEDQYRLYQLRSCAISLYQRAGFLNYAMRVARGEVDDCQGMRLARCYMS